VFYPNKNTITLGELSTYPAQGFNCFIRIVRVGQCQRKILTKILYFNLNNGPLARFTLHRIHWSRPHLVICYLPLCCAHLSSNFSLLLANLFPRSLVPSGYVSTCSIYLSACGLTKQATFLPAIGQRVSISAGN